MIKVIIGAYTEKIKNLTDKIEWGVTLIPLLIISVLCVFFMYTPQKSAYVANYIREFLGNKLGFFYILTGLGMFLCSMFIAFTKYGNIRLGSIEKKQYSSFRWGTMVFTSTMAADILYYSLCEWALYAEEPYIGELGGIQKWASTYPLFHWGPIPWSFYIVLAVAFGFMLHVSGRNKQKFSEACRPLLGDKVEKAAGKIIDLIAVFSLLAGTATTFSLATPMLSAALCSVLGITDSKAITISILLVIASIYTITVLYGFKGISRLAGLCTYLFLALLLYVLIGGGETVYIIETGISAIGNLAQNFIGMSTWMDPLRKYSFPQNWTIFYWAYWMVWCVATPFFIGTISRGRTIRETVLEGYAWGLAGTFSSFIILGNYGMAKQMSGSINMSGFIKDGGNITDAIMMLLNTLPMAKVVMILLVITMIAFYSTTFDALTIVMSSYSHKQLDINKEPDKYIRVFWSVLFILFPIALIFSNDSMRILQSVSIIAAFPIGIIVILIVISFFRDVKTHINEK